MEKLLEKKNNVRAYGGGEGGRKYSASPAGSPGSPTRAVLGMGEGEW